MKIISLIGVLPAHPSRVYRNRDESSIDRIVIHHTAGNESDSGTAARVLAGYAMNHVSAHGWPGLGYHYAITKDGVIFKCNPYTRLTYHAKGGNATGIGIALMGNFMGKLPSADALESLRYLTRILKAALPNPGAIRAESSPVKVVGHREVKGSATACPGDRFMSWIQEARYNGEI